MTMKKGDRFSATYSGGHYEITGKWNGSWVLSPLNHGDDECLLYLAEEIEELEAQGNLSGKRGAKHEQEGNDSSVGSQVGNEGRLSWNP